MTQSVAGRTANRLCSRIIKTTVKYLHSRNLAGSRAAATRIAVFPGSNGLGPRCVQSIEERNKAPLKKCDCASLVGQYSNMLALGLTASKALYPQRRYGKTLKPRARHPRQRVTTSNYQAAAAVFLRVMRPPRSPVRRSASMWAARCRHDYEGALR